MNKQINLLKNLLLCVFILVIVSGCSRWKNDTNILKKTLLPLAKEVPVLIENNDGISYDSSYLTINEKNYILFSLDSGSKKPYTEIRYGEILSIEPLIISRIQSVLPKTKFKKRYLSSIVKMNDSIWIYYVEGNSLKDFAKSFRAQWENGTLVNIEELNIDKKIRVRHWQRYYSFNNLVVMIYAGGDGMFFTTSKDGISFKNFVKTYKRAAKPSFNNVNEKTVAYSFQRGNWKKGKMKSMFSISEDMGLTWNQPTETTLSHKNVHDAFLFKRNDGMLDIYYVYPVESWRGFSLFRRCIRKDYSLGDEEQVIVKEMGNVIAPTLHRLEDNRIALVFNEQLSGFNPYITIIKGDSYCE